MIVRSCTKVFPRYREGRHNRRTQIPKRQNERDPEPDGSPGRPIAVRSRILGREVSRKTVTVSTRSLIASAASESSALIPLSSVLQNVPGAYFHERKQTVVSGWLHFAGQYRRLGSNSSARGNLEKIY